MQNLVFMKWRFYAQQIRILRQCSKRHLAFAACGGIFALIMALPSMAFDYNAYRAGNIYLTVLSNNPEACGIQCQGDASCKSWNFVFSQTARQNASSGVKGICEFNRDAPLAQRSSLSISGVIILNAVEISAHRENHDVPHIVRIGTKLQKQSEINGFLGFSAATSSNQPAQERPQNNSNLPDISDLLDTKNNKAKRGSVGVVPISSPARAPKTHSNPRFDVE